MNVLTNMIGDIYNSCSLADFLRYNVRAFPGYTGFDEGD